MVMVVETSALLTSYLVAMFLPPALGMIAGRLSSGRVSYLLCSFSCIVGMMCYPVWNAVPGFTMTFPLGSALGDYAVDVDMLTSIFVSISSLVFLMIVVHMSHSGHGYRPAMASMSCALFVSCMLCMMADTVVLVLVAWEVVSLVTFLMGDDGGEGGHRWRFLVITHVGGMMLICAFTYMWLVSGSQYLHDWTGLGERMGATASIAVILCLFIGFGTKLGTLPFHVWMPDMYSGSPTHTSALLTTVCSNVAVLVLFKTVFSCVGTTHDMVVPGVALCILSAATALWGAMESMIQREPRRILAYSSMENMALVTMCLSLGLVFSDASEGLMALVLLAGLLHALNHSVFKSLMMLVVDSVEDVTGEGSIDRYGGIACSMPALSAVALVGIASLAAVPPMNGFVSEWLMLQSLLGTDVLASDMRVLMPLLVAMVGVCGMVVATSYARLYGFTFLGRPRSPGASEPRAQRRGSLVPLVVLAASCVCMGLFATPLMDRMSAGVTEAAGIHQGYTAALSGTMDPLVLGLMIAGTVAVLVAASKVVSYGKAVDDTWGCGGTLDERMQYSSEGFSQPIVRVFHPFYGDTSRREGDRYSTGFTEPFVKYIYAPAGRLVMVLSERITRIQTGNIQSYLSYILVTLVVALLAVRLL
ncbi:MAG: hypothetical protein IJ026_06450 [Candidatus Methanomethylophilaceae archaeon]|nr:hypothetical protein [Candidatus Methanomethylophilaceae archaeon]